MQVTTGVVLKLEQSIVYPSWEPSSQQKEDAK